MTAPQTSRSADAAWNPRTQSSAGATGRTSSGEAEVRPTGCTATKHGNLTAYRLGCRCPGALVAGSRSQKRYRIRSARGQRFAIDATGTQRRLQALMALGWRSSDVAELVGLRMQQVADMQNRTTVWPQTAEKIALAYDALADYPGPSWRTRSRAAAKGWLVPLWWDDDTIDDPNWHPPTKESRAQLRREDVEERQREVARLTDRGLSLAQISEKLGVTARQVERDRMHNRETS